MACAASPAIESLELRFALTGWLSSKLRQARSHFIIASGMGVLALATGRVVKQLKKQEFELLTEEQGLRTCNRLSELCQVMHQALEKCDQVGIHEKLFCRSAIRTFSANVEDIEDILESWRLFRNNSFRELVKVSIDELDLNRGSSERSSSVAAVQG